MLLRLWWAVPILAAGLVVGGLARIGTGLGWQAVGPPYDEITVLLIGKALFGGLMGYVPLAAFACAPVAVGKWLAEHLARRG